MGVRIALGADTRTVVWLAMEVLILLGIGLAVGLPSALTLGCFVATKFYGIKAIDALAIVSVLLLASVACTAGLIPARRAGRMDPILALRYE